MSNSSNLTHLAAFRAYVEQHREDVLNMTLRGAPSLRHFTPYAGVTGRLIMEWTDVANVIKRWAPAFNAAANTITRKPVIIESHFQKAEASFIPQQDFFTYKGYLVRTKQQPADYPFAQYAMEQLLAPRIQTQMEFQQIFTGEADPLGTDAADMFNGLLTTVALDLDETTPVLTPVTTGALTAANIIANIEKMDDAISEEYRGNGHALFVAPEVFRLYRRAYRGASGFHPGNANTNAMDDSEIAIDGSSSVLISCPGMTGSQRIIATPKWNIYHAYDDASDSSVFQMEENHRQLDVWCDHWFGVGFLIFDPRIIYVNDQE